MDRPSPLNCAVYLFFLSPGYCYNSQEHLWKAFLHTFRICTALSSRKWEEGRYSTFLVRRHNNCWTHSPQTRSCSKNVGVLELFSRFRRAQRIEDLSESIFFFSEVYQIKRRFFLAKKKKKGVRCILRRALNPRGLVNSARVCKQVLYNSETPRWVSSRRRLDCLWPAPTMYQQTL